jgi:hypothetical protein
MLKRWWCPGVLLLSLSVASSAAAETDASTRAAARNIATAGVQALEQGDVELATQKLTKAYELLPVPSIALWLGRALAKKGLLVEAAEHFIQAGRLSASQGGQQAVQEQAQKDAARELNDLTPRIPKLVLTLEGAKPSDVTLSVDGKPLSSALVGEEQPINPGAHAVRGTRGAEVVEQSVTVAEGQKQALVLRFQSSAPATAGAPAAVVPGATPGPGPAATTAPLVSTPATTPTATDHGNSGGGGKTLGYVALVLGGAGLITGGITGALAISKRSALDDDPACQDGKCSASVQPDIDSFRTMRTASTIGFVAGGVCAGLGVVLLLTSGSSSEQKGALPAPRVGLRVAPNAVSLSGSF